ncbi:hypothetical protein, partial [Pseudomonas sp. ANT_J12]|uniref:hypothetical protein n=1 Tax=Pseudomonas sp. ANT_J12 TaxID=2597351 RepID=UPI001C499800
FATGRHHARLAPQSHHAKHCQSGKNQKNDTTQGQALRQPNGDKSHANTPTWKECLILGNRQPEHHSCVARAKSSLLVKTNEVVRNNFQNRRANGGPLAKCSSVGLDLSQIIEDKKVIKDIKDIKDIKVSEDWSEYGINNAKSLATKKLAVAKYIF